MSTLKIDSLPSFDTTIMGMFYTFYLWNKVGKAIQSFIRSPACHYNLFPGRGRLEILYSGHSYHYGSKTILPDVWTHIAVTSNGVDIITYINGIEDGRTNITLPFYNMLNTLIGAHRIYTGGDPPLEIVEEFPGIIDELRIWNIARSEDEIKEYYLNFARNWR